MSKSAKYYDDGISAFENGQPASANPHEGSAWKHWSSGWSTAFRHAEERVASRERGDRLNNVVGAIEAFIDAKIAFERRRISDPKFASLVDINETREHLRDKLSEAAP